MKVISIRSSIELGLGFLLGGVALVAIQAAGSLDADRLAPVAPLAAVLDRAGQSLNDGIGLSLATGEFATVLMLWIPAGMLLSQVLVGAPAWFSGVAERLPGFLRWWIPPRVYTALFQYICIIMIVLSTAQIVLIDHPDQVFGGQSHTFLQNQLWYWLYFAVVASAIASIRTFLAAAFVLVATVAAILLVV